MISLWCCCDMLRHGLLCNAMTLICVAKVIASIVVRYWCNIMWKRCYTALKCSVDVLMCSAISLWYWREHMLMLMWCWCDIDFRLLWNDDIIVLCVLWYRCDIDAICSYIDVTSMWYCCGMLICCSGLLRMWHCRDIVVINSGTSRGSPPQPPYNT